MIFWWLSTISLQSFFLFHSNKTRNVTNLFCQMDHSCRFQRSHDRYNNKLFSVQCSHKCQSKCKGSYRPRHKSHRLTRTDPLKMKNKLEKCFQELSCWLFIPWLNPIILETRKNINRIHLILTCCRFMVFLYCFGTNLLQMCILKCFYIILHYKAWNWEAFIKNHIQLREIAVTVQISRQFNLASKNV